MCFTLFEFGFFGYVNSCQWKIGCLLDCVIDLMFDEYVIFLSFLFQLPCYDELDFREGRRL